MCQRSRLLIPASMYTQVQDHIAQICATQPAGQQKRFLKIREFTFLVWLELKRHHVSITFIYFSQTLERLLFLRSKAEDWIAKG